GGPFSEFSSSFPIEGLGLHMSSIEYRTVLKYCLMIPLFPIDEVCSFVVRRVWIDLRSMQFIVENFSASYTNTTLFGISFLMFSSAHEYQ
ncbi:auxilin-like protein, partial [Trifolium pratense]